MTDAPAMRLSKISRRIREVLAYLPPEEGTAGLIERLVDCGALRVLNEDNANLYYTVTATEEEWDNGWHLNPVAALADALANALEQQVPRWVSVKERLPPEHESVIVHRILNEAEYDRVPSGWGKIHDGEDYIIHGRWQQTRGYERVTHWMPLPLPPEVQP